LISIIFCYKNSSYSSLIDHYPWWSIKLSPSNRYLNSNDSHRFWLSSLEI